MPEFFIYGKFTFKGFCFARTWNRDNLRNNWGWNKDCSWTLMARALKVKWILFLLINLQRGLRCLRRFRMWICVYTLLSRASLARMFFIIDLFHKPLVRAPLAAYFWKAHIVFLKRLAGEGSAYRSSGATATEPGSILFKRDLSESTTLYRCNGDVTLKVSQVLW